VDSEWREAGSRRETFYTNLGQGHYRFRGIVANNDGVWNERGASLEFTLCAVAVTFVWYAGYMLRVRPLTERMRARREEREHSAREQQCLRLVDGPHHALCHRLLFPQLPDQRNMLRISA
jgi:hypothetical protein